MDQVQPQTSNKRTATTKANVPPIALTASTTPTSTQTTPPVTEEWIDDRASEQARRAAQARHLSGRRRFVDPTTCEKSYSKDELEFMEAMTKYKSENGRLFPTLCEYLEVIVKLGYRKLDAIPTAEPAPIPRATARKATRKPKA